MKAQTLIGPEKLCQHNVTLVGDWQKQWRDQAFARKLGRYKTIDRVEQCSFKATVEIDGVPLCARHAGAVALQHLLKISEFTPD